MPKASKLVDRDQAHEYLDLMYGEAVDQGYTIAVFLLPGEGVLFFDDIDKAADACVERAASGVNVYCGMSVLDAPVEGGGRGVVSDMRAISALWSDIDIDQGGDAHKAKHYPKSLEEALEVAAVGDTVRPSFFVHSGNGIHAYWRLSELLEFPDDATRRDNALLIRRWQASVLMRARHRGYELDGTADLTRVLRVPGTINWKSKGEPKAVELHVGERVDQRWHMEDLEQYMVATEYLNHGRGVRMLSDVAPFTLDPDAVEASDVINAMLVNNEEFRDTWKKQRTDFADQSGSSYDFAICNYLVQAKLDDQRIVDSLIAFRRKHFPDTLDKKLRVDYYQRTIGKVRADYEQRDALSNVEHTAHEIPDVEDSAMLSTDERGRLVEGLRTMLRLEIERFIQVDLDGAQYFFELRDGTRFLIGPVRTIMRQDLFRERMAERMGQLLDLAELREKWPFVQKYLFGIRELEETIEQTAEEQVLSMLVEYAESTVVREDEDWQDALGDGTPYVREGELNVSVTHFAQWCRLNRSTYLKEHEIRSSFNLLRFTSHRREGRFRKRRRNRTYWSVPLDLHPSLAESITRKWGS
jgi:hypothetical protein